MKLMRLMDVSEAKDMQRSYHAESCKRCPTIWEIGFVDGAVALRNRCPSSLLEECREGLCSSAIQPQAQVVTDLIFARQTTVLNTEGLVQARGHQGPPRWLSIGRSSRKTVVISAMTTPLYVVRIEPNTQCQGNALNH
ncbi:hypothetical protein EVAR_50775_1 [Eumeta japonica]|uniref:Uncharacterized protein n=1 Tax=Eumeta variegata TaxID=151549 RepID=A0A4C1WUR1_EUMVA|nr:hypothetical protein EVAR_50775_1 [Eumeta japonica]